MRDAPNVNGPADIPKLRLYLLDLWRKGGPLDNTVGAGDAFAIPGQGKPPAGRTWGEWERQQLANAELWWVSADMTDLTQAVSKTIPEETTPEQVTIPSSSGLVVFEKPWVGVDSMNKDVQVAVAAVLWGRTSLGYLPGRSEPTTTAISFSCYEYLPEWVRMKASEFLGGSPLFGEPSTAPGGLRMDQITRFMDSGGHLDAVAFEDIVAKTPEEFVRWRKTSSPGLPK